MILQENLFESIRKIVDIGLTTDEVYKLVEDYFTHHNISVIPNTIPVTININNIIYHDTPRGVVLKRDDILTIDICFEFDGSYIDGAVTFLVGEDQRKMKLIEFNRSMLLEVIGEIKEGSVVKDVLRSVSDKVGMEGYYLVPDGLGHGIGASLHVRPFLSLNDFTDFNYVLKRGDRFTLEPIILSKKESVCESPLGVGYVSKNNYSSQFEVTLLIGKNGELEVLNGALLK